MTLSSRSKRSYVDGNVLVDEQIVQFRIHEVQDREVVVGGDVGIYDRATVTGVRTDVEPRLREP